MKKGIIPSLEVLKFYRSILTSYNCYRKKEDLPTFFLDTNPLKPMNMERGFQLNLYLYESEGVHKAYYGCNEKLTYRIDILVVNRKKDDDANEDLLALAHDLRQIIMQLSSRQLNLGFDVTKLEHPTFGIVTNATENPDLDYAFGQLEFSLDVEFSYSIDESMDGIHGSTMDWAFLINHKEAK